MSDWWRFWLMGAMWTLFGYLLRRIIELHNERKEIYLALLNRQQQPISSGGQFTRANAGRKG